MKKNIEIAKLLDEIYKLQNENAIAEVKENLQNIIDFYKICSSNKILDSGYKTFEIPNVHIKIKDI